MQNKTPINESAFKDLLILQEFLKNAIYDFQANYLYVKNYFTKYLDYCKEGKVLALPETCFFMPVLSHQINYLRIFSEIPMLCQKIIHENISKHIYTNNTANTNGTNSNNNKINSQ